MVYNMTRMVERRLCRRRQSAPPTEAMDGESTMCSTRAVSSFVSIGASLR